MEEHTREIRRASPGRGELRAGVAAYDVVAVRPPTTFNACRRRGSLHRYQAFQLLIPVLHDDDLRWRGGLFRAASLLDHQEPQAVG